MHKIWDYDERGRGGKVFVEFQQAVLLSTNIVRHRNKTFQLKYNRLRY